MNNEIRLHINGISVPLMTDSPDKVAISDAKRRLRKCGVNISDFSFDISKKSVDARHKDNIKLVYTVCAKGCGDIAIDDSSLLNMGIHKISENEISAEPGSEKMCGRPLVVGSGPAGMFCALMLAENGYSPILIERGGNVEDRALAVERFYATGSLNTESNIQFGAGGAGTFSDGKLVTRIRDPRCEYVLHRMVDFGAPEEIKIKMKPHIGTDILRVVVDSLLKRIEKLGGTVRFNCKLLDICDNGKSVRVKTTQGESEHPLAVIATGHSARDVFELLGRRGYSLEAKAFSVGVRVEQLQKDIDVALFGKYAGHKELGKGEYNLSYTKGERGVYTFCMCPGGEVVAAASENGGLVVNGMSRYARDGKNANCALAVSVLPTDFGGTVNGAVEFQRQIERTAYNVFGGYKAPVQTVGDFLEGVSKREPSRILPTYMGGNCGIADIGKIYPQFITSNLKTGLTVFEKRLPGFAPQDAVLTGVETRTSSPVRILRDTDMCAVGNGLTYPCGEGAGYAGGITSAAVDGIKVAEAIMKRFAPNE